METTPLQSLLSFSILIRARRLRQHLGPQTSHSGGTVAGLEDAGMSTGVEPGGVPKKASEGVVRAPRESNTTIWLFYLFNDANHLLLQIIRTTTEFLPLKTCVRRSRQSNIWMTCSSPACFHLPCGPYKKTTITIKWGNMQAIGSAVRL